MGHSRNKLAGDQMITIAKFDNGSSVSWKNASVFAIMIVWCSPSRSSQCSAGLTGIRHAKKCVQFFGHNSNSHKSACKMWVHYGNYHIQLLNYTDVSRLLV